MTNPLPTLTITNPGGRMLCIPGVEEYTTTDVDEIQAAVVAVKGVKERKERSEEGK